MRITRTEAFKEAWKNLSPEEKGRAGRAIDNLLRDLRYPSLSVKKMHGVSGIWEARVSRSIRITFEIRSDEVVLRNVGGHDQTLGRP